MVTQDPSENDKNHNHNGVWVIRKQNRRKRQGMQDEITGISSYFVVGENVYMAPSIGNILSSRLVPPLYSKIVLESLAKNLPQLSTVTSVTKMLSAAASLPDFTPAMGHTYFDPITKNSALGSSFQTTQTSEDDTPLPTVVAAGGTPLPTTQETSTTKTSNTSSTIDPQSSQILATSFDLFLRYGGEYMDENPLVGEPGSFKLSRARESGLAPSSQQAASQPFKATVPAVKKVPPLDLKTDIAPTETGRKGSASAKSPTTPGLKRKKERRKSKAAGVEEGGTPKAEG